jgi:hypothetical protein
MNATKLELNFGIILGLTAFLWSNLEKILDWTPSGGILPTGSLFGWYTVAGMILTIQAFRKVEKTEDWTWWKGVVSLTLSSGLMAFIAIPLHWIYTNTADVAYWDRVIQAGIEWGIAEKMVTPFATFKNYLYTFLTFSIGLGFTWASMVNGIIAFRKKQGAITGYKK